MTETPSQERLQQLESDIAKERVRARDEVPGPSHNPKGQEFYESGTTQEDDDQTIAPG